jgi:hypothetical protein
MESQGYSLTRIAFSLVPTLESWEEEEKEKNQTKNV